MKTSTTWRLALIVLAPVVMLVYAQVNDGGWAPEGTELWDPEEGA